jgi:hypothetical protein
MNDNLDIYTPLEDAKKEIWRRWNDKELRKKVEDFLGGNIPEPFQKEPRAVLARPITTPDIEHMYFLEVAKQLNLNPCSFEYAEDKFYTINADKLALAKMSFYCGKDEQGEDKIDIKKIINFKKAEGQKIKEMETLWGENFIDFHHKILKASASGVELFDGSGWYRSMGKNAAEYYPSFLAIFIRNGVLFENFLSDEVEGKFTYNIVLPAFKKVEILFGIKPLIVSLAPVNEASNEYWWCYPEFIKNFVDYVPKK